MRRIALLVLSIVLCACGQDAASGDGRPRVVATTTQVADLARGVAGDRAEVRGLLAANADPHDYEVRPSDLDALGGAALVLRSGGDLDEWLADAVANAGGDPAVVELLAAVRTREAEGETDPHWWQDPRNAILAVDAIRDALVAADPGGATAYRANATRLRTDLETLDRAVARCIATIAPGDRRLVTTHDSLGYYAERYGLEVVGAVIPSLSTRGQASAGETAALVETIRRQGVRAVFAERSLDPKVETAIAREAGAEVGTGLYADTLGPAGSAGETYVGSIRANTAALTEGLGDRPCRP